MKEEIKRLIELQQATSGSTSVTNMLLSALISQAPDPQRLLAEFNEQTEDEEVRVMNSPMPEEFVRSQSDAIALWREMIEETIVLKRENERTASKKAGAAPPTDVG